MAVSISKITRRKSLRTTRRINSDRLVSYTLDSLEGGVITIARNGIITSFNSSAENILGCSAEQMVGVHYAKLEQIADDTANVIDMISNALHNGATYSSEESVIGLGGSKIPLGLTISQLHNEAGVSIGVVVTFKDLAEIKRIRQQILRTEQMAALGYLSAGLAHELRNPLGSLHGMAELLDRELPEGDACHAYTAVFLREVERMNRLVEDLLCFAQPPISQLESHRLNDVVRESLLFAGYDFLRRSLTVKDCYAADLPAVRVDAERFTRALLNIIRNAFEACPDSGTISIDTGVIERSGETRCFVRISNTGSYIEPNLLDQIFTPFFTNKKGGTGLGLSIAHQIVQGHSGSIDVESDKEDGTTFVVELPTADTMSINIEETSNERSPAAG